MATLRQPHPDSSSCSSPQTRRCAASHRRCVPLRACLQFAAWYQVEHPGLYNCIRREVRVQFADPDGPGPTRQSTALPICTTWGHLYRSLPGARTVAHSQRFPLLVWATGFTLLLYLPSWASASRPVPMFLGSVTAWQCCHCRSRAPPPPPRARALVGTAGCSHL